MRIHSILIAALVLSAGLASAQRGMGRGAGHMPGGPAHAPKAAGAPNTPKTPHTPQAHTATAYLQGHPQAATRLAPLLPAGMTADQAAAGFKNWGQFVAALHVSKNLNIPFADLKAKMTGTPPMSLGKAIHELKPDLPDDQVKAQTKTAEREARQTERGDTKAPEAEPPKS